MARTRLIRPAFFSDKKMAALPFSTRLAYIGLWTVCDDAGFFEADVAELAIAIFPRETERKGERLVEDAIERLVVAERVELLPCGRHGVVPTLPDHRQKSGETLFTVRKQHDSRCLRRATEPPTEPATSDSVSDSQSSPDSSSDSLEARAREEERTAAMKKRPGETFAAWSARVAGAAS